MSAPSLWRIVTAFVLLLLGRRRRLRPDDEAPPPEGDGHDPSRRETGARPGAQAAVATLLVLAGAAGVASSLIYSFGADTQLLGLSLGLALLLAAAALITAAKAVFPRETAVEERPELARAPAQAEAVQTLDEGLEGVSRRRLLAAAAGVAGTGIGAAVVAPAVSLGPNIGEKIEDTPWHAGRVLVTEEGRALSADDVNEGSFVTAFPQGADPRELGSPVVVVRVDPAKLELPRARAGWAPEGILAYSKICTHAGCAIALYRSPLYQPTSHSPALVCPCHYSTFDVLRAARVEFGPAGRPLPQLPLSIRADRVLVAGGGFSGPIGPAWWSVRKS